MGLLRLSDRAEEDLVDIWFYIALDSVAQLDTPKGVHSY